MIIYYEELTDSEREGITALIRRLYEQTYLLDRKYDKRTGRYQLSGDYRLCEKHLEFLQAYFAVAGVSLIENRQYGVFYLQGDTTVGEKLGRLSTVYILVLKMIFDEKVTMASSSSQIFTTIGEIHEKISLFKLWDRKNPRYLTELKRTIALLKRYQIIDILETGQELEGDSRVIIYPTIHLLLRGEQIRELLEKYQEEEDHADGGVSDIIENVPQ